MYSTVAYNSTVQSSFSSRQIFVAFATVKKLELHALLYLKRKATVSTNQVSQVGSLLMDHKVESCFILLSCF
jgi:hypothetical protein